MCIIPLWMAEPRLPLFDNNGPRIEGLISVLKPADDRNIGLPGRQRRRIFKTQRRADRRKRRLADEPGTVIHRDRLKIVGIPAENSNKKLSFFSRINTHADDMARPNPGRHPQGRGRNESCQHNGQRHKKNRADNRRYAII